jgi:hypothetical protein
MYLYVFVCICMYLYVFVCICMYICIYVYVHIYASSHLHIGAGRVAERDIFKVHLARTGLGPKPTLCADGWVRVENFENPGFNIYLYRGLNVCV